MTKFTHLGRKATPVAVGLALAGAATGLIWPGDRTPARGLFETALTASLGWALARELDPDRNVTAVVAAVAAGGVSLWTGDTNVVALAALMLAARVVVRTTGAAPLLTDIVLVGVFVGVMARDAYAWATGLAVAAAIALDTSLPPPSWRRHVWLAAATGIAVTLTAVLAGAMPDSWQVPAWPVLAAAGIGIVVISFAPTLPLRSVSDIGRQPLEPSRLRTARSLVTGMLAVATLAGGASLGYDALPGWLVVTAAGGASWTGGTA